MGFLRFTACRYVKQNLIYRISQKNMREHELYKLQYVLSMKKII